MTEYLLLENPGVAPVEGFTLFGVSTSRGSESTIGEFGSGAKHGVGLLMRHGLSPVVYCGKTRLSFFTKPCKVEDVTGSVMFSQVWLKQTGPKSCTRSLGFTLEYGALDWTELCQALQEYVSNAIDSAVKLEGNWDRVKFDVVSSMRARSGYTRVYIPYTEEVAKFISELSSRYLHFSGCSLQSGVVRKDGKCIDENSSSALIYRKGVFVRVLWPSTPSLFDYNLSDGVQLDESRNMDEYSARTEVTRILVGADASILTEIFLSFRTSETFLEHSLDSYVLQYELISDETTHEWQKAWNAAFGPDAVACSKDGYTSEYVLAKGKVPIVVPSAWYTACKNHGISMDKDVLSEMASRGFDEMPVTIPVQDVAKEVWECLRVADARVEDKEFPKLACFKSNRVSAEHLCGFTTTDSVYINSSIASAPSDELWTTLVEELMHYISQESDMSRSFQTSLVAALAKLVRFIT